jgi:DNA-binding protein H-NS
VDDDHRLEDHAVGVELQIVELVEQRERAAVQERFEEVARIQREIDALQQEMTRTAEVIAGADMEPPPLPEPPPDPEDTEPRLNPF